MKPARSLQNLYSINQANQTEENNTPDKKELEICKTEIASVERDIQGNKIIFSVKYGNYVEPPVDGKYIRFNKDLYLLKLNEFLDSDAGKEYKKPSDEEINNSIKKVTEYIKEKQKSQESTIKNEQKVVENNNPEVSQQQTNEIEKQKGEQTKETTDQSSVEELPRNNDSEHIKIEQELNSKIKEQQDKLVEVEHKYIQEQKEKDKKIQLLEKQLAAKEKENIKSKEKQAKLIINANKTKDELIDNVLTKALSICLIISSLMIATLMFLLLYRG